MIHHSPTDLNFEPEIDLDHKGKRFVVFFI